MRRPRSGASFWNRDNIRGFRPQAPLKPPSMRASPSSQGGEKEAPVREHTWKRGFSQRWRLIAAARKRPSQGMSRNLGCRHRSDVPWGGPPIKKDMHKALKVGLLAGLIAPTLLASLIEPADAKKASVVRKEPPIFSRSLNDDVRCVERSFSVSVGNPAYRNRLSIWPAPCGR
jgi:hypothetical protein